MWNFSRAFEVDITRANISPEYFDCFVQESSSDSNNMFPEW